MREKNKTQVSGSFLNKSDESIKGKKTIFLLSSVQINDISAVQMGRQSEGLKKHTEEQAESRCFSIMFKSRRRNLDLMASSEDEAQQWVKSLQKLVANINSLNRQQTREQYPSTAVDRELKRQENSPE